MAKPPAPVAAIAQARRALHEWVETLDKSSDPARRRPGALQQISQLLQTVDGVMRSASPEARASAEWQEEVGAYAETLRELRAKLESFEIALRIRSAQLADARARASAVDAWAHLARHIG